MSISPTFICAFKFKRVLCSFSLLTVWWNNFFSEIILVQPLLVKFWWNWDCTGREVRKMGTSQFLPVPGKIRKHYGSFCDCYSAFLFSIFLGPFDQSGIYILHLAILLHKGKCSDQILTFSMIPTCLRAACWRTRCSLKISLSSLRPGFFSRGSTR